MYNDCVCAHFPACFSTHFLVWSLLVRLLQQKHPIILQFIVFVAPILRLLVPLSTVCCCTEWANEQKTWIHKCVCVCVYCMRTKWFAFYFFSMYIEHSAQIKFRMHRKKLSNIYICKNKTKRLMILYVHN